MFIKKIVLILLFSTCLSSYGQLDTNVNMQNEPEKIYNTKQLKKGFYKNYREFINNAPSIIEAFTIEQYLKSKKDSTVISAAYKLTDSTKKIHGIWGFCDGNSVYVNYQTPNLKKRFCKLDSLGPYNLFAYSYRSSIGLDLFSPAGLLITALTTTSHFINPAQCNVMVIDLRGNFQYPDHAYLKKLLSSQPDLKNDFEEEWTKYEKFDYATDEIEPDESKEGKMQLIKQYLIKLNERLIKVM